MPESVGLRFRIQEVWRRHGRGSALCRFLYSTMAAGSVYGSGRSRTERWITLKIAVFAPMPSARAMVRQP